MLTLPGCQQDAKPTSQSITETDPAPRAEVPDNLLEARSGFQTQLATFERDEDPLDPPQDDSFSLIQFDADLGPMSAYLSRPADPKKKHAAMIWVTGGFPPGGIDASAWEPSPVDNDQSAKVYRESGLIMMYPTFRGCCGNPGNQEGFFGEVNDVISAAEYLREQPFIDPDQIYLGGHSTGGTLVLLVAAATDMFRGVISFGPVEDPHFYGDDTLLHRRGIVRERTLRAPINYMDFIRTPTVVVEGTLGNLGSLVQLQSAALNNSSLSFVMVPAMDHFEVLSPVNAVLAKKIISLPPTENLTLTVDELAP